MSEIYLSKDHRDARRQFVQDMLKWDGTLVSFNDIVDKYEAFINIKKLDTSAFMLGMGFFTGVGVTTTFAMLAATVIQTYGWLM